MLAKSLLAALLAVSATASPIIKRDAATVLSDLETILSDVETLDSVVSSWDGSLLTALTILTDYNNLKSALDTAITDTEATSTLSDSDSSSITSEVQTLGTSIVATLDTIIDKESVAASAGVSSTLLSSVETLQTSTNTLGADLEAIATSSDAETIASVVTEVDAAFSSAIAAYS
ncbi:hypothetical protein BO94DRAFT_585885 [Aspergillus sclerotioniger CBS 115572]|uniref:Hydrophobic surface binding protein A n=1 Tax=Aspergillus sclerotioniger CBS 115572 TaxID=1450535 RepID=A0A317WQD3_9EURO|nr:hypothetical protein BO94DRAFT_585885 [Aspergillus sclerotioniger CBS 115572]PWY87337.1 hypothetical protein BO94DRAFT_585885 [Aspergillus sclerotioniger CBS 115572]